MPDEVSTAKDQGRVILDTGNDLYNWTAMSLTKSLSGASTASVACNQSAGSLGAGFFDLKVFRYESWNADRHGSRLSALSDYRCSGKGTRSEHRKAAPRIRRRRTPYWGRAGAGNASHRNHDGPESSRFTARRRRCSRQRHVWNRCEDVVTRWKLADHGDGTIEGTDGATMWNASSSLARSSLTHSQAPFGQGAGSYTPIELLLAHHFAKSGAVTLNCLSNGQTGDALIRDLHVTAVGVSS